MDSNQIKLSECDCGAKFHDVHGVGKCPNCHTMNIEIKLQREGLFPGQGTGGDNLDDLYTQAFEQAASYWKEIAEFNREFVKQFGETAEQDFGELCEDCNITSKVEFVDAPMGYQQQEDAGIFKDIYVDQHSVGDSGDSYAGAIYANVSGKWIRVYYEC